MSDIIWKQDQAQTKQATIKKISRKFSVNILKQKTDSQILL